LGLCEFHEEGKSWDNHSLKDCPNQYEGGHKKEIQQVNSEKKAAAKADKQISQENKEEV